MMREGTRMGTDDDRFDPLDEDARLRALGERLRRAEAVESKRSGAKASDDKGDDDYRLGNRVLAELLGGMIGGALVGWVVDRVFDLSPLFLLLFLGLGIIVAFRNIFRLASGTRTKR